MFHPGSSLGTDPCVLPLAGKVAIPALEGSLAVESRPRLQQVRRRERVAFLKWLNMRRLLLETLRNTIERSAHRAILEFELAHRRQRRQSAATFGRNRVAVMWPYSFRRSPPD